MRCAGAFPDSVDVLGPAEASLLLPTPLWPDSEGESLLLCSAGGHVQDEETLLLLAATALPWQDKCEWLLGHVQGVRTLH